MTIPIGTIVVNHQILGQPSLITLLVVYSIISSLRVEWQALYLRSFVVQITVN